ACRIYETHRWRRRAGKRSRVRAQAISALLRADGHPETEMFRKNRPSVPIVRDFISPSGWSMLPKGSPRSSRISMLRALHI
ncbi:MAG: hypothetical protein RBT86_09600, partial [Azospira sp.]|nr:hypothetical protein [Azospira sp.]